MIGLTSVGNGLHMVAKEMEGKYPAVDSLIFNVKKIFVKAALRVEEFKEGTSSMPLPSQSILAHWGMWLDAVIYYFENHCTINKTLSELDSNAAWSIKFSKEPLSSNLSGNLAYFKSNFMVI
jgi:hypothetical protein